MSYCVYIPLAPKISKEMGFVNFETWTAEYCDHVYRAIGKEVSNAILCSNHNRIHFVVWSLGAIWNKES